MGLFGRKKEKKKDKRKEEINLNINLNDDLLLEDNARDINNIQPKFENIEVKSEEQLTNEIISTFTMISNKNSRITKEYYTCKILSRVGLKDLDFNMQVITMDKHVNRMKKDCFDLSRIIDNMKYGMKLDYDKLVKIHKQVMDLQAFQLGVLNQLTEINNNSYGHLKISTVTITINKTNDELEKLYNNISNELKGFKTFSEAAEFIFYNSGGFIDNLVSTYIKYVKNSNNQEFINTYNRTYFLPSDVVISLEFKEWIELYKRLKYVLRLMIDYKNKLYIECDELFKIFEAKYAILMMYYEQKSKK